MLRAEHGCNLENPFKYGNERLFIKLGALRKVNGFAEVVELEYVRAALRARKVDFRCVDFGKVLALQILAEPSLYAFLYLENRTFLGCAR